MASVVYGVLPVGGMGKHRNFSLGPREVEESMRAIGSPAHTEDEALQRLKADLRGGLGLDGSRGDE